MDSSLSRQRGSKELWLNAAYDVLVTDGIGAVKIMGLAKKLNLTRTGFYWFFADLNELHLAMIERWENQNTGNLVARCQMDAPNICAALFNVMDCWLDTSLFDDRLDLAIRNWARVDSDLKARLTDADDRRIEAIAHMFSRHGYSAEQSQVRSMSVVYTQIGYISMQVEENRSERLGRVQHYVEIFSGTLPSPDDIQSFLARHS